MTIQRCITFQRIDNHAVTEPEVEDRSTFPTALSTKKYTCWEPVMMTAGTVNNVANLVIMWERETISDEDDKGGV